MTVESFGEFVERNAASEYTDRSGEAAALRSLPYDAYVSGERAARIDRYRPSPRLRELARRYPELVSLVGLPPDERAFYLSEQHLPLTIEAFPKVPEDAWATLST